MKDQWLEQTIYCIGLCKFFPNKRVSEDTVLSDSHSGAEATAARRFIFLCKGQCDSRRVYLGSGKVLIRRLVPGGDFYSWWKSLGDSFWPSGPTVSPLFALQYNNVTFGYTQQYKHSPTPSLSYHTHTRTHTLYKKTGNQGNMQSE